MMRKLDSLVPAFLKDFDKYLLLHYPRLWATKVHYLMFFVAGSVGMIGLRAFLTSVDVSSPPDPEVWFFITIAPVVVAFLLWAYTASVFEVERFFGITSRWKQLGVHLIYLCSIMILGSIPFIYANVLSNQLARSVDDATLVADIDALNLGDVYFPMSEHDQRTLPDLSFGDRYAYAVEGQFIPMHGEELTEHFQHLSHDEVLSTIATYQDLIEKYSGYRPEGEPAEILHNFQTGKLVYVWNYEFDAAVSAAHQSIDLIDQAKTHQFDFQDKDALLGTYITLFLIWLTFMIFTRTRGRQFLVTVVSGFALFIAATVLAIILNEVLSIGDDFLIGTLYISIFAILTGQAFLFDRTTKRMRFWNAIGLALATAMTPFLFPVLHETLNLHGHMENVFLIGTLFSFLVWTFAFNRRFVDLQAAPQQD